MGCGVRSRGGPAEAGARAGKVGHLWGCWAGVQGSRWGLQGPPGKEAQSWWEGTFFLKVQQRGAGLPVPPRETRAGPGLRSPPPWKGGVGCGAHTLGREEGVGRPRGGAVRAS